VRRSGSRQARQGRAVRQGTLRRARAARAASHGRHHLRSRLARPWTASKRCWGTRRRLTLDRYGHLFGVELDAAASASTLREIPRTFANSPRRRGHHARHLYVLTCSLLAPSAELVGRLSNATGICSSCSARSAALRRLLAAGVSLLLGARDPARRRADSSFAIPVAPLGATASVSSGVVVYS